MPTNLSTKRRVIDARHPSYLSDQGSWEKWRYTYRGGDDFIEKYMTKIDRQEDPLDFKSRKDMAPAPTFAKAAVNDVRNSIFQRMRDIVRRDGSESYHRAAAGLDNGVDLRGSTMNGFFGKDVLTELLVMGRCGLYVDSPTVDRPDGNLPSLADVREANFRPYIYMYQVEDILSWRLSKPEEPSEFQAVLLRDTGLDFDDTTLLPIQTFERYRLLWIDQNDGLVRLQFFDDEGATIDMNGDITTEPFVLNLNRIPFVMPNIGDSLLRDVYRHQIALMNLTSRDVAFAYKVNFPIWAQQKDLRAVGDHLKHNVNPDGTAEAGGQEPHLKEIRVGLEHGIEYDLNAQPPRFIHPSSETLISSMALQKEIKEDIRRLINLAVTNTAGPQQSADSKAFDNQGLEAGLSFIGLVLENAEQRVADYWASYESVEVAARQIAVVKYPERYALRSDEERIQEASGLVDLIKQTPSATARKELWKTIITILLGGRISVDDMNAIVDEIDTAAFTTSDPDMIFQALEKGVVGEVTANLALGFRGEEEMVKARQDHANRLARISEAQSSDDENDNLAARGLTDFDDGSGGAQREREEATNPDLQEDRREHVRGEGKQTEDD